MLSRLLGLVREILIAALLGAGPIAEAFFVAFRLPNMFRRFFAEGAFNMAFVPLFAKSLEGEGRRSARNFAEETLAGLLFVLIILTLLGQLAMPWIILGLAYGFSDQPDKLAMAVAFGVIQFPYLMFMSLMALFGGVLNAFGRFAAAAGAPILLNVSMIAALGGAFAVGGDYGYWLSWSVLAGGIAQFLLVARAARRLGFVLRLRRPRWTPRLKRLVTLGAPAALAGGVMQINLLIGTVIASFYAGAVVWLALADRVYQLPLGLIGVAIGVALLPELSRLARAGDGDGAASALGQAVKLSMFFTLPAAVALAVISEPVVRVLFERGAFTPADVAATADAVFLFALGLPAYVAVKALSPAFFAVEDTRTPLYYAAAAMATNVIVSLAAAPFIEWRAVPVGTAAAAYLNAILLWREIVRRGGAPLWRLTGVAMVKMAAAAAVMGAALWGALAFGDDIVRDPWLRFPALLGLVTLGLAVYLAAVAAIGAVRLDDVRTALKRRSEADPTATRRPSEGVDPY